MGRSTNTALAALKIGGRVAYERLARPKARLFDDVPCTPYAVTAEWLTAVLCNKTPGAIVTQVDVKPASAGTHERHQLKVSYNEEGRRAGLPVSIFTKSLPSIVTRMIGGFNGTARVEGSFFTQIRPELEIEAPLCHHSAYDRSPAVLSFRLRSADICGDPSAGRSGRHQIRDVLQSQDLCHARDGR